MLIIVGIFLTVFFDLRNIRLEIPITYDGGDDFSTILNVKNVYENGWCSSTDRLGAPFGNDRNNDIISNLYNSDIIIIKVLSLIIDNHIVTYNVEYILLFPIIAIVSYIVLRQLRIKNWISVIGAITYAFSSYLFIRGQGHFELSSYYFVPLSTLICIWIFYDKEFLTINKDKKKIIKNAILNCK